MALLGIAIVHYHAEGLLAECLQRLRASTVTEFEACVVDCGSTAGLAKVMPEDARFTLLEPGMNLGFSAANNRALARLPAECRYLLCLNPDVMVKRDTLERMLARIQSEPDIGAATCRLTLPSGMLDPACRRADPTLFNAFCKLTGLQKLFPGSRRIGRYNLTFIDPDTAHEIDSGSGAFLLIRREALEAAGGQFDERFFLYGEDLDLCRRIRQAGYRILYLPEAHATHVKGSGRVRALPATRQFYRAMWTYYRKWGRFRSNPFVLSMLAMSLLVLGMAESLHSAAKRLFQSGRPATRP